MADSFFGFDISVSNLNDDEGGGEPSEDEYDALNDETFGHGSDEFDWEMEHEQLAEQLESSRRHNSTLDETAEQLEASLSQLVLDETDAPQSRILGSSVWRNDLPFPAAPTPVPTLKNVCTVEELERQLRQKQMQTQSHQQNQAYNAQNYYQPRFPPVILQRPPGLQAPVPLPFAPQQPMGHNMNQMGQPLNKMMSQSNQMGQTNQLMSNHVGQGINQLGQNVNQMGQNVNQLGQTLNQFMQGSNQFQNNQGMMNMSMQNVHMGQSSLLQNQMAQNVTQNMTMNQMGQNQLSQNMMQMGQNTNQLGQTMNQNMQLNQNVTMNQSVNQMGPNIPLGQNMGIGQNIPQINQNVPHLNQNMPPINQNMPQMTQNQMGQSMNKIGQNMNQMGQNVNQMMPNGSQFGQMNQYAHSMGQPRMMAPPPGINMPRQNFSSNMGQYNPNFRQPMKPDQPNMMMNQMMVKNQQPLQKPAIAQSPQNKTVVAKKVETKPKTRVYNNSKGLTSQNLVQIIQNTHPILQMNNSYHNASHHPMLNRSMFNNQNHLMMNRQNGTYNNSINGDDGGSDSDEYAGLMTQREKQWLINIQMLQLNTGTPYIHDFYYTVFLERQARKEKEGIKEAHKANQQNHPFYSGAVKQEGPTHRERHNSHRHNSTSEDGATPRAYVPTQFENSLGKLQCGSVTAPRKIIDVEVVGTEPGSGPGAGPGSASARSARTSRAPSRASRASTTTPAEAPREMKRTKQLLLDIEALYLILLRLEELNDPLAITNALILKEREEKQKQLEAAQKEAENNEDDDSNLFLKNIESVQRRPKQDSPKSESIDKRQVVNLAVSQKQAPVKNLLDEDKDELVNKMFAGLLHGDRLQQMLTVRKGRALVCRFLRRCGCGHARVRFVWARVLRALPGAAAARKDHAGLHALAHHYRSYIQATSGWSAIQESCAILTETLDPARTPYVLTTSFTLSAVCALVEKASALVNTPEPSSSERQWFKFLKTLARALKHTTLQVARPIQPLPEAKLIQHIKQLESRSTIEILQRGKTADFEMTKAEVSEHLVKHLC